MFAELSLSSVPVQPVSVADAQMHVPMLTAVRSTCLYIYFSEPQNQTASNTKYQSLASVVSAINDMADVSLKSCDGDKGGAEGEGSH